eukprot:gnl/MRDRNA2_/MRDRNA2_49852_c0_seq1.p1 gnl/MRDRNA2_/MRDRNA2_49852_c0~~gnl/MRDRNA2_/MRDRNA2_49852_c0_seq1.p1  ORF type:complete len:306 (-),score=56.49 gnl/MRDRNA2_/MRDRNA2_49852_c0_seq1:317-1234(-)
MGPVDWQSQTARGIAQRLWMRGQSNKVQTFDSLNFGSSISDDEDDRASQSTIVGDSSGSSTDRGSNSSHSRSGSERSSPIASAAFPPSGCGSGSERASPVASAAFASSGCGSGNETPVASTAPSECGSGGDTLSMSSYAEEDVSSSLGSSPSRLPGHMEPEDKKADIRREAFHRKRQELRSFAKILAEGAGHDYRLIKAAFKATDPDNSGWVSAPAFERVFVRFGVAPDVASRVFQLLEHNKNGCANYMTFMAWCGPILQQGLRAQPRFQPPAPPLRQQEQRWGPHGWRQWRLIPAVSGQRLYLS